MNEWKKLEQAILAQEALRATLGDAVVETTIAALREQQAVLEKANLARMKQRKYITVLFADVSGFTKLSETRDHEEINDMMKALWEHLDPVIVAHGGLVDKHIGDALMALFGAPTAQENDPERAVRAALALQAEVLAFGQKLGVDLSMRVGVNSGQATLDVVGSTKQYTATGDSVNVASRMETAAPVGGILISQDTYQHVQGLFEVEQQEPEWVKGKSEPIHTYVVKRALPHIFQGTKRGLVGIQQQMIGREQELRVLQNAFEVAVSERELQMITIVGEVGLGKTRLLQEFGQWLTAEAPLTWYLKGRPTYTSPYALTRSLFAIRFDIREQDDLVLVQEKLEQGMMSVLGEDGLARAHFVGQLVGYDFTDSPYLRGLAEEPQQVYQQALHDVVLLLQTVAAEQPIAIFLEDAHWADEASLDFVMALALRCRDLPLLIVTLARPGLYEKRPYWGEGRSFHTRRDLAPLLKRESRRLVSNVLQQLLGERPSNTLRDLIVTNAEGNPFYAEELIRMFHEDGTLADFHEGQEVRVPPTLFGVLQARLDRLTVAEQATLQQGAVVGRVFWDKAIAHLRQEDQQYAGTLLEQFDHLRQRRFIEARVPSVFAEAREFQFHNSLLRDTAYEAVLIKLRRRYHRQVAVWLAEQYGAARANEKADEIATHYELAGETVAAADWYGRAADQAARTYALDAAVHYYQKALMLSADEPSLQRISYLNGLGDVRRMQSQYDEAMVAFQEVKTLAVALQDTAAESRAWRQIGLVQGLQAQYEAAWESTTTAEALARQANDLEALGQALLGQGWAAYRRHNMETALGKVHEALQVMQQVGDAQQTARGRYLLLLLYTRLGHLDQAWQYGQEAQAVLTALGDKEALAAVLSGLGNVAEERGEWATSLHYDQEMLKLATEIGRTDYQMNALLNIGQTYVKLAEWDDAVASLQQLLSMPNSKKVSFFPLAQASLAQAYLGQEKLDEALSLAGQAVQTAQLSNHPYFLGAAWQALAMVLAQTADPPTLADLELTLDEDKLFLPAPALKTTAALCFAHSAALFDGMGMKQELMAVLELWAEMEAAQGDVPMSHQLEEQVSLLWWALYEQRRETAVLPVAADVVEVVAVEGEGGNEEEGETAVLSTTNTGIPADLNKRLRDVLLSCGPFSSQQELQAIFVDARIHHWRNHLPEAGTIISRMERVVDFLWQQQNSSQENGLLLFLQVLSERLEPEDGCWQALQTLVQVLRNSGGG